MNICMHALTVPAALSPPHRHAATMQAVQLPSRAHHPALSLGSNRRHLWRAHHGRPAVGRQAGPEQPGLLEGHAAADDHDGSVVAGPDDQLVDQQVSDENLAPTHHEAPCQQTNPDSCQAYQRPATAPTVLLTAVVAAAEAAPEDTPPAEGQPQQQPHVYTMPAAATATASPAPNGVDSTTLPSPGLLHSLGDQFRKAVQWLITAAACFIAVPVLRRVAYALAGSKEFVSGVETLALDVLAAAALWTQQAQHHVSHMATRIAQWLLRLEDRVHELLARMRQHADSSGSSSGSSVAYAAASATLAPPALAPAPAALPPLTRSTKTSSRSSRVVHKHLDLWRAYAYPYARPQSSYVLIGNETWLFDTQHWTGLSGLMDLPVRRERDRHDASPMLVGEVVDFLRGDLQALTQEHHWAAILAVGSNASPQQLTRKFHDQLLQACFIIPVVQCVLDDFDVVYAAGVSSYGACTATLQHSPGTRLATHMLFVREDSLCRLNWSEGSNYNLCCLHDVQLHVGSTLDSTGRLVEGHRVFDHVGAYVHASGCWIPPGQQGPLALMDVSASGRRFRALTQKEALATLHSSTCAPPTSRHTSRVRHGRGVERPLHPPSTSKPSQLSGQLILAAQAADTQSMAPVNTGGRELDAWVSRLIREPRFRAEINSKLRESSAPLTWSKVQVLERCRRQ